MSESEQRLSALLATLTDIQRVAAEWENDALLLLAGPGSGKTRVLTARIARLLVKSPSSRWRVLALTFTNRAADEMRSRILDVVPDGEDRLFIGTFHSFACEVLRQSGSHLGIKTDFKIYSTQTDRLLMLKRALSEADVSIDAPPDKILPVLDRLRDGLVPPEECERLFQNAETGRALSLAYKAYDNFLTEDNTIDFPGLIFKAHFLFKNYPAIARRYSSSYKHLCLDEFQDTSASQYALLRAFTGASYKNVFAVADDDQIIYQWNGASHKRLGQFQDDYSPERLQLPTNFRCPSSVVALANNLVAHNRLRSPGKEPLRAGKSNDAASDEVRVFEFPTDAEEAVGIAADISTHHRDHVGRVTVIARTKALLEGAKDALQAAGIEAQIAQRRDSFASLPYIWLQSILNLANRRSDESLFSVFGEASNKFLGINLDVPTIAALAAETHGDLLRTWTSEAAKESGASVDAIRTIECVASQLAERTDYRKFIRSMVATFNSKKAAYEEEFPLFDEDTRAWADLSREISATIGANAGLEAFLQELEMRSKEPPMGPGVLPLLTIHGSKGNEFDHVYIIGLAEDMLPSFQSKQKGNDSPEMEEERRNCFVAITRCMETLTLSYARRYRNWSKTPSRFLAEMGVVPSGSPS